MNIKDLQIRDPFIYKENGKYYLTGTHYGEYDNALFIYESDDLVEFKQVMELPFDNRFIKHTSWAPEIHKYKSNYFIFITLKEKDAKRGTYILFSSSLTSGYKFLMEEPITPKNWECLDATLFVDSDGQPYLVFCREWLEVRNGEMYIAKLAKDLKTLIEEPHLLFRAGDPEWSFPIYGDGYVTDGPFLFKMDNKYHMIWSSFCKRDPEINKHKTDEPKEYALSHIESLSLYGPWIQEKKPLINYDAGHGMVFEKDNELYISLHYPNGPAGLERLKIIKFK